MAVIFTGKYQNREKALKLSKKRLKRLNDALANPGRN